MATKVQEVLDNMETKIKDLKDSKKVITKIEEGIKQAIKNIEEESINLELNKIGCSKEDFKILEQKYKHLKEEEFLKKFKEEIIDNIPTNTNENYKEILETIIIDIQNKIKYSAKQKENLQIEQGELLKTQIELFYSNEKEAKQIVNKYNLTSIESESIESVISKLKTNIQDNQKSEVLEKEKEINIINKNVEEVLQKDLRKKIDWLYNFKSQLKIHNNNDLIILQEKVKKYLEQYPNAQELNYFQLVYLRIKDKNFKELEKYLVHYVTAFENIPEYLYEFDIKESFFAIEAIDKLNEEILRVENIKEQAIEILKVAKQKIEEKQNDLNNLQFLNKQKNNLDTSISNNRQQINDINRANSVDSIVEEISQEAIKRLSSSILSKQDKTEINKAYNKLKEILIQQKIIDKSIKSIESQYDNLKSKARGKLNSKMKTNSNLESFMAQQYRLNDYNNSSNDSTMTNMMWLYLMMNMFDDSKSTLNSNLGIDTSNIDIGNSNIDLIDTNIIESALSSSFSNSSFEDSFSSSSFDIDSGSSYSSSSSSYSSDSSSSYSSSDSSSSW